MLVQHIVHGLLVLIVVFFGLPAILSLAIGTITGSRSTYSMAERLITKGIHTIFRGLSVVAEALAATIAAQYPEQTWLLGVLKPTITALFALSGLFLLSILTSL
jgi:hypothetical protein